MLGFVRGLLARFAGALDRFLPGGPEDAATAGRKPEPSGEEAARRLEALRIRMKEKEGKGGYR